jgi:hypothetical protein
MNFKIKNAGKIAVSIVLSILIENSLSGNASSNQSRTDLNKTQTSSERKEVYNYKDSIIERYWWIPIPIVVLLLIDPCNCKGLKRIPESKEVSDSA